MTYVSDLHSTYVQNCMEYLTQDMKFETLRVNKNLLDDLIKKVQYLANDFKGQHNKNPQKK